MILHLEMGKQNISEILINKMQDAVKMIDLLCKPPKQKVWFFKQNGQTLFSYTDSLILSPPPLVPIPFSLIPLHLSKIRVQF